jgi:hypothetical protein
MVESQPVIALARMAQSYHGADQPIGRRTCWS